MASETKQSEHTGRITAYRNLNKRHAVVFSIKKTIDGRSLVVDYWRSVLLTGNIKFKHANAKQLARIRTGCREVCQYVTADRARDTNTLNADWRRVDCDPKTSDGFRDKLTGEQIDSARAVLLCSAGMFYLPL